MKLEELYELAFHNFSSSEAFQEPISKELLLKLLDIAHLAPSDHNLQPTHYYILSDLSKLDAKTEKKLRKAAFGQSEILAGKTLIAFCGDRKAASYNLEEVIDLSYEKGSFSENDEERLRSYVKFNFDQGLLGLTYLVKLIFSPLLRLITPLPLFPAVHKRYWLTKQVTLSCANFMLAAKASGLSCTLIQCFDEGRIRKILDIPHQFIVPMVVCIGRPKEALKDAENEPKLPLEEFVHFDNRVAF